MTTRCSSRRWAGTSAAPTSCSGSSATCGSRTWATNGRSPPCAGPWSTRRSSPSRPATAGVRTPRLLAIATVEPDGMLLAYEAIDGSSLDGQPDEALTDEVLDRIWAEVGLLRQQRIAHRDLRLANVFLADDGVPWMIDFGFSELAVTDERLAQDVAQLVTSTALKVGAGTGRRRRGAGAGDRRACPTPSSSCSPWRWPAPPATTSRSSPSCCRRSGTRSPSSAPSRSWSPSRWPASTPASGSCCWPPSSPSTS